MLLETLATSGLTPKKSSVGKVISVPEPTIVLMMPAPVPASAMATPDQKDTRSPYRGRPGISGTGSTGSTYAVRRRSAQRVVGGSGSAPGRSAGAAGAAGGSTGGSTGSGS